MNPTIASEFCKASVEFLDQSMVKIRHCVGQLNEDQIWWRPLSTMNSIGNLCVHLDGNLRQWGVIPFTGHPDVRQREQEFCNDLRIPSHKLLSSLEETVSTAKSLWGKLTEDRLLERKSVQGFEVSVLHAISHTSGHFVGHAHQIISLARLQLKGAYQFHWTADSDRKDLPI
jgi:hypothetical protein